MTFTTFARRRAARCARRSTRRSSEPARHRRQREPADADADEPGEDRIAPVRAPRGLAAGSIGGSRASAISIEDGRDHLDDELGQGEVRRGEVEEGERHDEPDDAREDEGDEPLPVPDHAAERGSGEHESRDDAERRERQERARHRLATPPARSGLAEQDQADHEQQRERARQRAVVEPGGGALRDAREAGEEGEEESPRAPPRRDVQVEVVLPLQRPVEDRAAGERQRAQQQRRGEPVPERDRVRRQIGAEHRARGEVDERPDGQAGQEADRDARPRPAPRPAPS